jgi:hypothetical protein
MKNRLLFLTLFLSTTLAAQNINFLKSYGNTGYDYGKDIKQTPDTGYIATGSSSSFTSGNADAFLLKVDSLGNFKWSYNYGGSGADWGEKVILTQDNTYTLAGYTNSSGAGGFDFYMVHAAADGTPLWEKTYGGTDWDRAHSLAQLSDSGFVLVGETYSFGEGSTDIYIVRTDKVGNIVWTETYGGPEADYANDVIVDGDSIVVVGGTESFGEGMSDGIILKYHQDGTLGWMKTAGKEREDYFTSVIKNSSDEYFLGGTRLYYYDLTGWLNDFWIYNMSEDGTTVIADTSMTGGSHEVEVAYDVVVSPTDNIFYAGETKSFGHSLIDYKKDAFIGRLNNDYYQAPYVQNFGADNDDIAFGLDYCMDGGLVGVGQVFAASTGGYNMFIIRIDKNNSLGSFNVLTDMENDDITLSITDNEVSYSLNVYPTVFVNEVFISGLTSPSKYQLFNYSGELLQEGITTDKISNLTYLSKGLYFLQLSIEGQLITTKLIKN